MIPITQNNCILAVRIVSINILFIYLCAYTQLHNTSILFYLINNILNLLENQLSLIRKYILH